MKKKAVGLIWSHRIFEIFNFVTENFFHFHFFQKKQTQKIGHFQIGPN